MIDTRKNFPAAQSTQRINRKLAVSNYYYFLFLLMIACLLILIIWHPSAANPQGLAKP